MCFECALQMPSSSGAGGLEHHAVEGGTRRRHGARCTPSSHTKNSLSMICFKGWVGLQGNTYTICAKNFQGLDPKRPESWIANWV